ncbi:MAG: dTDP-4-dehydrorhamnose 3,5-epimerase [Promethearchaeota archaeon]
MEKIPTRHPDIWIIKPQVFKDDRGFFLESYSKKKFDDLGFNLTFIQDNHSRSTKNTVRGLHFQAIPEDQTKLVRCIRGKILDISVDIRPDSPRFRESVCVELSDENFLQVLVPSGFAHGFSVLSDVAEIEYKVNKFYSPELERAIRWDDPSLNLDWKVSAPILSEKDRSAPSLSEYFTRYGKGEV